MIKLEMAQESDVPVLAKIQSEVFKNSSTAPPGYDSPDWLKAMILDGTFAIILSGDKIIGGLIFFPVSSSLIEIERIFIAPGEQRKGNGKTALELLRRELPEVKKWTTGVNEKDPGVVQFFEKCGFRQAGSRSNMEGYREIRLDYHLP